MKETRPTSNPHFRLLNPPVHPRSASFCGVVTMAKPSAVTHLHLLCDQDLVSSRKDDDELKEEEIVDDQRFGVVKATRRNSAAVAHSRAFLDLLEFWFNFESWSSRIILFGWWENLHGFGIELWV
ncbi:hypothetical protein ACFX12_014252 [Malus domestica]